MLECLEQVFLSGYLCPCVGAAEEVVGCSVLGWAGPGWMLEIEEGNVELNKGGGYCRYLSVSFLLLMMEVVEMGGSNLSDSFALVMFNT